MPNRHTAAFPFHQIQPAETGTWIAMCAIAMCFAALTSALVVRQGASAEWIHFELPRLLYASTAVLLTSALTLGLAQTSAIRARAALARFWLLATAALGATFLLMQFRSWRVLAAQGILLATSGSASFFYVLTAFHACCVAGGVVALTVVASKRSNAASTTTAATPMYWSFVTALWVYVFLVLAWRI